MIPIEQELYNLWLTLLICFVGCSLSVGIHFELVLRLGTFLASKIPWPRFCSLVIVVLGLAAHLVEICLFAYAYYLAEVQLELGKIEGKHGISFLDYFYFSGTTFTTLGIGDVVPTGLIRIIVVAQALLGLVLIAWTATITLFQMRDRSIESRDVPLD